MEEFTNQTLHQLLLVIIKDIEEVNKKLSKQNSRISKLEKWRNMIVGALILTNVIFLPIFFIILQEWVFK